jgi:condensin complex subunit 1
MSDFNLSEIFSIYTRDCGELVEDIPVENSAEFLDSLTDALAVTPERLAEEENFNGAIYLLNSYEELDGKSAGGLLDLIVSGLKYETQQTQGAIDSNDVDSLPTVKGLLERYAFLLHWYLNSLERITLNKADAVVSTGKGSRTKVSGEFSAACQLVLSALEAICSCLRLNLGTIFVTSSETDLFTSLFLKPVYQMMEHEQVVKNSKVRMHMFKVICLCVKMHSQQSSVQTSLMQLLIYFEHLPEPLAELLQILHEQFDHVAITEDMLKELSNREFNSNDTKGPKLVSQFLTRLSQLIPQVLMKQMSVLVKLLDIESFTLRCSVIEATGSIITYISQQEEDPERQKTQIHSFLDLVEERTLDVNPYCRCRAIQALTNVCELESKLTSRRPNFTAIAVRCLTDKSSLVRRNGIKLLSRLISTHPFDLLHGPQLDLKSWNIRLEQLQKELDELQPDVGETTTSQADESAIDGNALDAPSDDEQEGEGGDRTVTKESADELVTQQQKEESINRLKLTKKYYLEAIEFIHKVHEALGSAELLLFSKNKNEIIDSMDLFVLADAFGIEIARVGIRKMIHLIWAKANNDEGSAIQSHLISCYQSLFFDTPIGLAENDANLLVARNLISLTYSATLAELASLEHLLVLAMEKERLISNGVIKMLWKIYGYQQREISKSQRRGAIIVLGMLSKADSSIANAGLELLLKIGLGEQGRKDLGLAKYTCIVLQHCVQEGDWKKMRPDGVGPPRFAPSHEVIEGLCAFLLLPYQSMEWFGVAEQAIRAINDLCESPDLVYSKLVKIKTQEAFEGDGNEGALSQLLFIVGDVALKIMVHLERCEALFKRSKIALEKSNAAKRSEDEKSKKEEDEDLEMVGGGTSEDDFTEAITYIREREMLYGKDSLLARFGNLVSDICKTGLQTPYVSWHSFGNCTSRLF